MNYFFGSMWKEKAGEGEAVGKLAERGKESGLLTTSHYNRTTEEQERWRGGGIRGREWAIQMQLRNKKEWHTVSACKIWKKNVIIFGWYAIWFEILEGMIHFENNIHIIIEECIKCDFMLRICTKAWCFMKSVEYCFQAESSLQQHTTSRFEHI